MQLICNLSHIVDEDDDGNIRTVRNEERAELIREFPESKSGRYFVGVPHNGAQGFYSAEQFAKYFRIEGGDA
jgi:hypothetical protein